MKATKRTTSLLIVIYFATLTAANAQNANFDNVSIGTSSPAYGVRIRANFPGVTGGWARGFSIDNQSGAVPYFEIGALGSVANGVSTFSYGYIGKDYANRHMTFYPNYNIGMGTAASTVSIAGSLSVVGNLSMSDASTVSSVTSLNLAGGIARAVLSTSGSTGVATFTSTSGNGIYSFVTGTGYVKIGAVTTPNPAGYKLFVDQGILTEKVKVAVAGSAQWADHVFHKNYQLMPLEEVEQFIQQNKHLPNIPSADEMVKEGNDLGKTDAKLLEKIEELTLYLIALKKQNEKLEKEVELLKQKK
ncbi:MAG: TMF family protein [Dinghuibacter sp.]|nr:TMF family protein [Dinghuibacter sp.]